MQETKAAHEEGQEETGMFVSVSDLRNNMASLDLPANMIIIISQ